MPKQTQRERVGRWQSRVQAADSVYDEWATTYRTDVLEPYYQGHQWKDDDAETPRDAKYVINLVFPTIEIELPNLLFHYPTAKIRPQPARSDDPGSELAARAALMEAVVQQQIEKKSLKFLPETSLALFEAFFRFGVVEVGYTADLIDNPNAGKPMLTSDNQPELDRRGEPVVEPSRVPKTESLYIRRIPAKQWRVSQVPTNHLDRHDWVGYYDWVRPEDLKANKRYKNTSSLRGTGQLKHDDSGATTDDPEARGLIKVWKIWDLRDKVKHVFADNHEKFFMEDTPWTVFPFATIMFHPRLDEWYPLPPSYNWLGPQNELNETREMQRVHRKRTPRSYSVHTGSYDPDELEKLRAGEDMTIIERKTKEETLAPIKDAPLDLAITRNVAQTQQDFTLISGVSSEQRQVSEAETATQATIIETHSRIRESKGRRVVGTFLSDVIRIMLLTMREHFTLPMALKAAVDPRSPQAAEEAATVARLWNPVDLGDAGLADPDDFDFDVDVDVESLSPLTEDAERIAWTQLLAQLNNPTTVYLLAHSDYFLKQTLRQHRITSDEAMREFKIAAQGMLQLLTQGQGGATSAPGPQGVPQGTGPSNPVQVLENLASQLGP